MAFRVLLNNPPVLVVREPWYDTPESGRTGLAYLGGHQREHSWQQWQVAELRRAKTHGRQIPLMPGPGLEPARVAAARGRPREGTGPEGDAEVAVRYDLALPEE